MGDNILKVVLSMNVKEEEKKEEIDKEKEEEDGE